MEYGNDGPPAPNGPGAGAGAAAALVFLFTTGAYLFSGFSLWIAAVTFAVVASLLLLFNAAYDRYVL